MRIVVRSRWTVAPISWLRLLWMRSRRRLFNCPCRHQGGRLRYRCCESGLPIRLHAGAPLAWSGWSIPRTHYCKRNSTRHHASLTDRLKMRYLRGVGVIAPGLLNCFLTCVAGALANVAFEHWSQSTWGLLARRILVGYLGAVGVVILVLPWLHRASIDRRRNRARLQDSARSPDTSIERKDVMSKGTVAPKQSAANFNGEVHIPFRRRATCVHTGSRERVVCPHSRALQ